MAKKRILVADDDQLTREAVADFLADEGYEVALAANGHDVLFLLATFQPDLVLTDLNMPGLRGTAVLAHVKQVSPTIPVLIFTAEITIDAERLARRLGVADYLNKPLDLTDMLARIVRALTPQRDQ